MCNIIICVSRDQGSLNRVENKFRPMIVIYYSVIQWVINYSEIFQWKNANIYVGHSYWTKYRTTPFF